MARGRTLGPVQAAALLLLLLVLLLAPRPARAQTQASQPTIYTPPAGSKFRYSGCFNETTDLPGTARERALDGSHRVAPGSMTVQACIDFCGGGGGGAGDKPFKYAGLEFSRYVGEDGGGYGDVGWRSGWSGMVPCMLLPVTLSTMEYLLTLILFFPSQRMLVRQQSLRPHYKARRL